MIKALSNFRLKNRTFMVLIICLVGQLLLLPSIIMASGSIGANRHQTNRNEVTNFFDQEVEDRQELKAFLENSKSSSEQGVAGKGSLQLLGVSENELEGKTSELNSINANSLESAGHGERAKEENSYYDQLEVDYTDPKILNHKKDIDKIADANEKLMSRLIEGLRDSGVDCKTFKGNKEIEPEYIIEIKKEHLKDTIYNQHICEELRNKYNCNDSVNLRCSKRGMKWDPWQNRSITMLNQEIPKHWWILGSYMDSTYPGRNGHGCRVTSRTINPAYHTEIAVHIANTIGVTSEQIQVLNQDVLFIPVANRPSKNVDFSNCSTYLMGWYVGTKNAIITFHYQYRDGHEICEQWTEDWNEVCKLQ